MTLRRIHLERVDSTNRYLSREMGRGVPGQGLRLRADYQEHGRGQGSNRWESSEGKNLLMSVLLHPAFLSASEQFHLTRLASLSLCDLLESVDLEPVIKWPNDVLVGKRKIAGVLIENGITGSRLSHTIMGFGLNLNQSAFPAFPVPATSLVMEGREGISPAKAAGLLERALLARYEGMQTGEVPALEKDYLDRLMGLDLPRAFQTEEGTFTGIVRGVDLSGQLLVEREGQQRAFAHGQIRFLM